MMERFHMVFRDHALMVDMNSAFVISFLALKDTWNLYHEADLKSLYCCFWKNNFNVYFVFTPTCLINFLKFKENSAQVSPDAHLMEITFRWYYWWIIGFKLILCNLLNWFHIDVKDIRGVGLQVLRLEIADTFRHTMLYYLEKTWVVLFLMLL